MPGKLNFISQKFKSNSVSQIDAQLNKTKPGETVKQTDLSEMGDGDMKNAWFKTWPERSYDKLDQTNESSPEEENGLPTQFESTESHVPLNKLLDKIPLAYSPITKQLHMLSSSEQQKILVNKNYNLLNKSDVLENGEVWTKSSKVRAEGQTSVLGASLKEPLQNKQDRLFAVVEDTKIGYSEQKSQEYNQGKSDQCALKTEVSSFSSIVSSLSDNSPTHLDETASSKLSLLDNDDLSIRSQCSHDSGSMCSENSKFFEERNPWSKEDNKRRGLSAFFSRNVFMWKAGAPLNSQGGWKIFGKNTFHVEAEDSDSSHLSNADSDSQQQVTDSPLSVKKYEDVVASSSALILLNRPANLPAKSLDEELKHRLEYEQMVEAARKKEIKESKRRKKQLQQQLKFEEQLANSSKIWNNDILPKWEGMRNSKKAKELWWAGLPPSVRGKVWKLAIGNELNITYQLYEICAARAQERLKAVELNPPDDCADDADKESSVELIQLDISRTFPQLCIFQRGGPYYDILHCLLGAYVCYRPDMGYVQGMSFIAAILILNLEPPDAFICFSNLLNRPCHMAFFSLNESLMHAYYDTYDDFFRENLPKLSSHFQELSLTPDLYLLDWVYSVFAKAMPLDIACRVWDVFLRDGEEFLFRTALGILNLYQEKLMKLDFINGAQFLTKLPEDLSSDLLFKSIESIKLYTGKLKFAQVLASHVGKSSPR